jgi:hypothetical protein
MKEIGGYFELELRKGNQYHPDAIALNTGRNALELILITKKFSKVYIPYFTCDVVLEPFIKQDISYEYYSINIDLEPEFDYSIIKNDEGFLYTNYFGLKDAFIEQLVNGCKNLIIDNTQSFFSMPLNGVPTFYSCRKFLGVPDGAYLYLDNVDISTFPTDYSDNRMSHLLKRIDRGASDGYADFRNNDISFIGQPILRMSKLTRSLLCNIDYEYVKRRRLENFAFMHENLCMYNEFDINLPAGIFPMLYPFFSKRSGIKQKLIKNQVYIPTYWTSVLDNIEINEFENCFVQEFIYIPIDHRYSTKDLDEIIQIVLQ